MRLTEQQQRAVQSWDSGDICVVAGPGSGKTRVLVERVRWLIEDRKVAPERILAITFTEKAAHEMQARLVAGSEGSPEARGLLESARISTIDAFCNRLLREHAIEAGVDPGFEMIEEAEARTLLHRAVEDVLDRLYREDGPAMQEFLETYVPSGSRSARHDATRLQDDLAALVTLVRSHGCEPSLCETPGPVAPLARSLRELASEKGLDELEGLADRLDEAPPEDARARASLLAEIGAAVAPVRKAGRARPLVEEIKDRLLPTCRAATAAAVHRASREWLLGATRSILEAFSDAKLAAGLLDFDDVLARAGALLAADSCPDLRFEHVLIDEFQDTNPLQVRLVESLLEAHGPKRPVRFVVGDINQSIYGFRHADQNVFRRYRQDLEASGGEVIRLLDNFRSRPGVLEAVHRILPGGAGSGVEEHRLSAANRFPEKERASVEVQIVRDAGQGALEREAEALAGRLHELKAGLRVADRRDGRADGRPLEWRDVAVLVRTHDRAARLASALRGLGVPCRTASGGRLFDAPETAELAAFLRVLRNPRDEISLAATLKSPFCGLDDAALLRLKRSGSNLARATSEGHANRAGLDEASRQRLARFRDLLDVCRADRELVPARFLLARAVAACGYRGYLSIRGDEGAAANLDRLLQWIGRREGQGADSLDRVSEALDAAISGSLPARDGAGAGGGQDAAEILTVHAAKGLEFRVVALASMQSSTRGPVPGLLFSAEHGIGARWLEPGGRGPVADAAYELALQDLRSREREEDNRLLYVAMTRAEEHLILSASFPGDPEKRHWCKPLFERLGIDPKGDLPGRPERREAGRAQFALGSGKEGAAPPGGSATGPQPCILRPLAPSAQADYSAAVTSVAMFAQCPRRYFLSRVLALEGRAPSGLRADPDETGGTRVTTDASTLGSNVHLYLAGQLADPEPEVRRLAAAFQEHDLGLRAARAESVEREAAFAFTIGDRLLRGTVDLLFEEGGERVLVDYKTDRKRVRAERGAADAYATQLQLYAAGLAKAGRPVDRAAVFYLRRGTPVETDVSAGAIESATETVTRFFEAQSQQDYPLRAGKQCLRCPHFRGACPAQLA